VWIGGWESLHGFLNNFPAALALNASPRTCPPTWNGFGSGERFRIVVRWYFLLVLLYAVHSTTPAFWASRSYVHDLLLFGDTRRTRPRKGDSLAQDGDFRIDHQVELNKAYLITGHGYELEHIE
jgi:hypothetical protein